MKKNYVGIKGINNFGSEMIIIRSDGSSDLDVYFPKYDWVAKHRKISDFTRGKIKCPYEPRLYGVGYIGEGKYKVVENKKQTKAYNVWNSMFMRCYCEKYHKKHPIYINCEVCEEWHNFQNFAKWFEENYYEIEGEIVELDKDAKTKGNLYSPDRCLFIPSLINKMRVRNKNKRNDIIGIREKSIGKFSVRCKDGTNKEIYLGTFNTKEEAFMHYKIFKESLIKQTVEKYKNKIPTKVYNIIYNYKVEIDD